ncbi:hypothetical protein ACFQNE_03415 [Gordonia phosphorivorans]|uniref:Mce-associated membrane protein n=1 Tax=Gordonia phosphorivorans TaxID=1056982 RepID=A0ABV6HBX8_9ACTN
MSSEQHDIEGDDVVDTEVNSEADAADTAVISEASTKTATSTKTAKRTPRPGADRHWASSLALATGSVALAGAVACLGYFGYTGISAYLTAGGEAATLRDDSVDAAEQAILNVTNIDVNDIDGWEKRLQSSLTGTALKQTQDGQVEQLKKELAAGKRVQNAQLVATISRAAATEVNVDENEVTVLVFSTSTAKGADGAPAEQVPMEFLVTVVEADGMRKASNIVPLSDMAYLEQPTEGGR